MGAPPAGGRLVGGRYRLEEPLGRGGMGVVWRGRDEVLGRAVTVKEVLLPPGLSRDDEAVRYQRTLREARAAARLHHPNVVLVFDVVEEDERPWIVMELIGARSLAEMVDEHGPLPPRRVAEIGHNVLAALRVAHGAGVLHRDVKPSNVLLADDGRVVLTDFGIAAVEGDSTLTGTGNVLGSPAYTAPERARGDRGTAASDLWALGATLYTAVEGRPPYERGSAMATLTAVVTEEPDPVARAGPLGPLIEALLHKDPEARPSADDAVRLLGEALAALPDVPSEEGEPAPPEQTRDLPFPTATGYRAPAPPEGRASASPRARTAVVAGICVLAAAGALITWGVSRDDNGAAQRPARPASSQPGRAAAPAPPETPPRTSRAAELPDGFHRHQDPTGFSVAVPDGWRVSREGPRVKFDEPDGGRFLIIDQTDDPKPDPVADWEQQEDARASTFPGYRRIRIAAVDYHDEAADWEFTYAGDGGRIHVVDRGFVTDPDQAYAIYWSTPEDQWEDSRRYFDTFTDTFRPAS